VDADGSVVAFEWRDITNLEGHSGHGHTQEWEFEENGKEETIRGTAILHNSRRN